MTTNLQESASEKSTRPLPSGTYIPKVTIDAFLLSKDNTQVLENLAADRRMTKATITIQVGGLSKAVNHYATNKTPNLIIVEVDIAWEQLEEALDKLAVNCPPSTSIVVIGTFNDIKIYRALMEKGVNEYLVSPVSDFDLMKSITSVFSSNKKQKLGRISAFLGTRGGSGSSTIAQNVAVILAQNPSSNVLLIDVDYPFGTTALNLNIDNQHSASELLSNQENIDDGFLDRISIRYGKHLRVIGAGATFDQIFDFRKDFVTRIVDAIHEGACHAIIDLPTSWSEREAEFLKVADDIVLTATPDLNSMRNTKQLVEHCARTRPNDPPPLLVMNQIGMPKRPEIKKADFAKAVRLTPSATIPFDANAFGRAANNGQTIYETTPRSLTSNAMIDLASLLDGSKRDNHSGKIRTPSLWERFVKRR